MLRKLALFCTIASIALAGGSRRVVIIDIDGVRWDTFEQAYREQHLWNFERILGPSTQGAGFRAAAVFENATTVFPTVTMAAQASIFTGVFPGRHGIPGNDWFDRAASRLINYMTPASLACVYGVDLFTTGCDGGMANDQLESPTIYEIAARAGKSSTVAFSQYYKGATIPIVPSLEDALALLQGSELDFAAFDTRMMDRAIESLSTSGLPDILTVYFAGADGVAHAQGIASEFDYLRKIVDPQLGRLLAELALHDPQWSAHTLFVITSDHGRTDLQVHPEDQDLDYRIQSDLARVAGPSGMQLVENGGMAYVYVPSEDQVMSAARELVSDPSMESTLDYVLARQTLDGAYHLVPVGRNLRRLSTGDQALLNALDSQRTGDIILLLKAGHYFGNK